MKNLPFKKEYLLIAGTLVLFWICYQLAFKRTIEAWQLHSQLNSQLTRQADVSYQPGYLERKNSNLSRIIASFRIDSVMFRSNTITEIAALAEKEDAKLSAVPTEQLYYHTEHYILQQVEFEGDSFSLISLLNTLQKANNIGYVRSVSFKVKANHHNREEGKKLLMDVFLEAAK